MTRHYPPPCRSPIVVIRATRHLNGWGRWISLAGVMPKREWIMSAFSPPSPRRTDDHGRGRSRCRARTIDQLIFLQRAAMVDTVRAGDPLSPRTRAPAANSLGPLALQLLGLVYGHSPGGSLGVYRDTTPASRSTAVAFCYFVLAGCSRRALMRKTWKGRVAMAIPSSRDLSRRRLSSPSSPSGSDTIGTCDPEDGKAREIAYRRRGALRRARLQPGTSQFARRGGGEGSGS